MNEMNVPANEHDKPCPDCGHYLIRFHLGGLGCWYGNNCPCMHAPVTDGEPPRLGTGRPSKT